MPQQATRASDDTSGDDEKLEPAQHIDNDQAEEEDVVDLGVQRSQKQRHRLVVQVLSALAAERVAPL